MESELPNVWWLIDPDFIRAYCEDRHIEPDEDNHYTVKGEIEDLLRREGAIPEIFDGVTTSTQVVCMDNPLEYRKALLRLVSLSKHYGTIPQVNIILTIPKVHTPFPYMNEIMKITKGVRTFIKPVITFIDFDRNMVTVDI